jgi:hypothetical protein
MHIHSWRACSCTTCTVWGAAGSQGTRPYQPVGPTVLCCTTGTQGHLTVSHLTPPELLPCSAASVYVCACVCVCVFLFVCVYVFMLGLRPAHYRQGQCVVKTSGSLQLQTSMVGQNLVCSTWTMKMSGCCFLPTCLSSQMRIEAGAGCSQ